MSESLVILLIDDRPDELIPLMEDIVNEYKHTLITAEYGKEGIRLAKSEQPDIILLDINMPLMDGFEVCSLLKKDPETNHIPVIFMTSMIDPDSVLQGFKSGAVDYIIKPVAVTELLARISVHVGYSTENSRLKTLLMALGYEEIE